jgi:hypothetical protein
LGMTLKIGWKRNGNWPKKKDRVISDLKKTNSQEGNAIRRQTEPQGSGGEVLQ